MNCIYLHSWRFIVIIYIFYYGFIFTYIIIIMYKQKAVERCRFLLHIAARPGLKQVSIL